MHFWPHVNLYDKHISAEVDVGWSLPVYKKRDVGQWGGIYWEGTKSSGAISKQRQTNVDYSGYPVCFSLSPTDLDTAVFTLA